MPLNISVCLICSEPLSCWTRIYPAFANSEDPDMLASDLDLHCLPLSMWIYNNNPDQVIWVAENYRSGRGILIY